MAGAKFTTTAHASAAATDKIPALKSTTKGYLTPALTSALALSPPQGRLTLTTAVPVTVSDVTNATTIYYTPYTGDRVPIYDGTDWRMTTFTELSNATAQSSTGKAGPAAVGNNLLYDLFVWSDSGTIRLTRGPAWASDTARTDALTLVNGVYLNGVTITNGPAASRGTYVGTVRSNGSAQIVDSFASRWVWNMYNRRPRAMRVLEGTDSWSGSGSATFRQMNNAATNQLDFVRGLDEDNVSASASLTAASSGATLRTCRVAIGLDATNALATGCLPGQIRADNQGAQSMVASYNGLPGLGRHYLAALEMGAAADTQTFYGDAGGTSLQSGITGEVFS